MAGILGRGGCPKTLISYLNKTTKTPLHISHITQVKFVSASQKLLLFPAWLVSIYPLRATIGYLKIMLQAAGPRAADCRHFRITTEELSGMFVSIQPLNRSEGLNGRRTFLEMETPTTSTPMTRDGLPQVQTGCWWECFPQLSSRNGQILLYFLLTVTNSDCIFNESKLSVGRCQSCVTLIGSDLWTVWCNSIYHFMQL